MDAGKGIEQQLLQEFLFYKQCEGSKYEFLVTCKSRILNLFSFCSNSKKDLLEITLRDAMIFQRSLVNRGLTKDTVNVCISIARVFYNYLILIEVASLNPFRLLSSLRVQPTDPPHIPIAQIKRIFNSLDNGLFSPLVYIVIFECLYGTGVTGVELMYMRADDFNRDLELLYVRATRKTKAREVPLPAQSVYVLKHYITFRKMHFPLSNYLITTSKGNKLNYTFMRRAIKELLGPSPIKRKGVSVVKNSYRKHLLLAGAKLESVSDLTGRGAATVLRFSDGIPLHLKSIHNMTHPKA